MRINETVKELRVKENMTQAELAEKLNCNRQKIADWERGKTTPAADDIILLAKIFNVSADYLLGISKVKTNDRDVRFICDFTGLSDHSVTILHEGICEDKNANEHDSYHDFIEFILDEKNTITVLSFLFHLRMYRDKTREYQEYLRDTIQKAEQILEDIDRVNPEVIRGFIDRFSDDREKEKDYAEFRLQKSIKRLYEDFGSNIYTVNESEEEIKKLMHLNLTITDEYLKRYESGKEGGKHGNHPET